MSNNIKKQNNNTNNNNNNAKKNNNDNNSKSNINKNSKKNNNNSNRSNKNKNNKNKIENETKKEKKFAQQKQANIQEIQLKRTVVDNEKSIDEVERFRETLDIREKRIGIVFKVIYVIAIFFGALFLELVKLFGQGLTYVYILVAGAVSFLLVMIGYTVLYIINEMKCLKINSNDLPKSQVEITERSYSQIFINLRVSGIILLSGSIFSMYQIPQISNSVLVITFYVSLVAWGVVFSIRTNFKNESKKKFLLGISCVAVTIMIMSILLLLALKIAT